MTKILIDLATAQQAFEALKEFGYHGSSPRWERTANALKTALEQQPVQEPTLWRDMVVVSLVREGVNKHKARELADHFAAQPVQEPVALHEAVISAWSLREVYFDEDGEPSMHRSPPQRPWVGLTEEEIEAIGDKVANEDLIGLVSNFRERLARAIEAKLKEKNNV